jgi:hypothetical protein
MKTECIPDNLLFQDLGNKEVIVKNDGEDLSSDGGLVLLRQIDLYKNITQRLARCFNDNRNKKLITHELQNLLKQRIYGLCQGYEDLNDHDIWRNDRLLLFACGLDPETTTGAGKSTLNRMELGGSWHQAKTRYKNINWWEADIEDLLIDLFIESYDKRPKEIILDVDNTDLPLYGMQEGKYFNAYYDEYCYLPLLIMAGDRPVWAKLVTSDVDPASGTVYALKRIIGKILKRWPDMKIIVRGDSGFGRNEIMEYCESNDVLYVLGLSKNNRLKRAIGGSIREAELEFKRTGIPQRIFRDIRYKTRHSWPIARRVIGKAEHIEGRSNPRFVVTNISNNYSAQWIYETLYCARGNMENRIKEQKLFMFADRMSTQALRSNQFRLWLSVFAYVFMVELRDRCLDDTTLHAAQASTIRLKLLKVGAWLTTTVRRIVIHLPRSYPYWNIWATVHSRLCMT